MEVLQSLEFRPDCNVTAGMSQPSLVMDIEVAYNDYAGYLGYAYNDYTVSSTRAID